MKVALKEFLLFCCAVLNVLCSTVYGMERKETAPQKKSPISPERLNAQVAWLGEFMAFIDTQKGVRFKKSSSRMDALNGPIMTIVLKLEDDEQKQPLMSSSSMSSSSANVMAVPSVQSMSSASASTTTVQKQLPPYTISASAKKVWETKVATNAPVVRAPQVQQIVEEDQIGPYPGEMPLEGSDMSCHWCFGC